MKVSHMHFDGKPMLSTASRCEVRRREVTSTVRMTWWTNRVNGAAKARMLASIINNSVMRGHLDGFSR